MDVIGNAGACHRKTYQRTGQLKMQSSVSRQQFEEMEEKIAELISNSALTGQELKALKKENKELKSKLKEHDKQLLILYREFDERLLTVQRMAMEKD